MSTINQHHESKVADTATDLLNDGKKLARELYEEGLYKINEVEDNMKEHSEQLIKKIKQNPLSSVLIAGGIGFLLSKLLK